MNDLSHTRAHYEALADEARLTNLERLFDQLEDDYSRMASVLSGEDLPDAELRS